jgi:hypothetical protein
MVFAEWRRGDAVDAAVGGFLCEVQTQGMGGEMLGFDTQPPETQPWLNHVDGGKQEAPEVNSIMESCTRRSGSALVRDVICEINHLDPEEDYANPACPSMDVLEDVVPEESESWVCGENYGLETDEYRDSGKLHLWLIYPPRSIFTDDECRKDGEPQGGTKCRTAMKPAVCIDFCK